MNLLESISKSACRNNNTISLSSVTISVSLTVPQKKFYGTHFFEVCSMNEWKNKCMNDLFTNGVPHMAIEGIVNYHMEND